MKIIPKKIKFKNTIWKWYSLLELVIILILFLIVLMLFMNNKIVIASIILVIGVILFIPTSEGIFYIIIWELIRYCFSKKRINKEKLIDIKNITDDGIIEYKNNMFGKVIKLGQKNFFLEDEESQEVDISNINKALKHLDIKSTIDIVKIDKPINFDDYIRELNNRIMNMTNNYCFMKERILLERRKYIENLNYNIKQYISSYYIIIYNDKKNELKNITDNVILEIKKTGIEVEELDLKESAVFLKYNYYREFDEREVHKLNKNQIIDWIYPDEILFYSNKYFIDNIEASVMSISDYPLQVKNGWASEIFNIPNTKVVMNINSVDKYKAIRRIDQCILEMETKELINNTASEVNSSIIHKETMMKLLNSLQAEDESLLDVSLMVTSYNYNNDNSYKRKVKRIINSNNFKISTLFAMQYEGFISSSIFPINKLKKYQRSINSNTLASFFPFVRDYVMDSEGIVLGHNINSSFPFILDIWKRGELYQNSNAFVIGKSGSGKSYFLKNLLINEWSNNTKIIICDPEAEYLNITNQLSGNIVNVGNSKDGIINPFHIYKMLTDDGTIANPVITFNTHLKMLESFFKIVLEGVNDDVIELINYLVIETYKYKGINENIDCANFESSRFPIFSDLMYIIDKKIHGEKESHFKNNYLIAKLHIEKFVNGRYSDIWNSPSTLDIENDVVDFNFQTLFYNKNNIVANAQMLLIFRFIEQQIINTREINRNNNMDIKTLIIIDEAHLFIDPKYPIALDFFYQMNKRIRKYNGAFIPTTQNISDWNSNEELRYKTSTILKNSQYNFIFKLSSPDMQDVLDIYKCGNSFNKEERMIIISSTTGQAFFIGTTELRTPIKIIANEYVHSIINDE